MTDQPTDNDPVNFDALAEQIDGAVGASARAATGSVEAILRAAVQEGDEAEVADCDAEEAGGDLPAASAEADVRSSEELQTDVREADQAEVTDSNADIDGFIEDALAEVEEIAAIDEAISPESDANPTLPPQHDSADGANDRAFDGMETVGSADTSEAVESVLAEVQASVERLADALTTDAQPAALSPTITIPVGMPTASPPADEAAATEEIVGNVEAGGADLTDEIGDDAEQRQASEAPADAPASPPTGVDEIEQGIRHFAQLLTGEVEQLWVGARQALSEARLFRDELKEVYDDARQMFADIQATRDEMIEIRDEARIERQEARNLRDDIQKTLERIRAHASEAANASDQAQSEARAAATHADRARQGEPPDP